MISTPRLTRAGPARPLGGRILSLLQSRHTQSMPLRLPHWSLWVIKPSMTSAASARTPGPVSVRPPQTGPECPSEGAPAQERTPFNRPHDCALRRPVAPPGQLAYLRWYARPGGQTCRARHCSSGRKMGERTQSPKRQLLNMDGSRLICSPLLLGPNSNRLLGKSPQANPCASVRFT